MSQSTAVLHGVTIVDATTGLAGPAATRWLAELGADVVKVEPPGGDPARRDAPAGFATWNRSKRTTALDLATDDGRERLHRLLAGADVFVHELTPGRAAACSLTPDALAARHPGLIVASVTAYPVGHADAERYGDELLVQARLGIMDEQEAHRPGPMFIRLPVASWGAAYLLAGGIAARLVERERTGVATPVHTSLAQGALAPAALYWQRAGAPPRWLAEHTLPKLDEPPHLSIFRCADGRWIQAMGGFTKAEPFRPVLADLGADDLFGGWCTKDNRDRWASVFATRTVDEWTALLWPADVTAMPILAMGEVLGIEQARANGYAVEVDDPTFGPTLQAASPFTVGGPIEVRSPAPLPPPGPTGVAWSTSGPDARPTARHGGATSGSGPLAGLRVLDFGAFVAGPFGGQCLADFGADVVKIEPLRGEKGREINQFTGCNRAKRTLALDLRHPRAAEVLLPLLRSADVVMHNMRLSAAAKMGLDEASLRRVNPTAVFAHSSGYGTEGPWSALPAFDPTAFALSGFGHGISGAGNRPSWLRMSAMDCTTGIANFVAIALALYARERTGSGIGCATSLTATAATFASETVLSLPGLAAAPVPAVDDDQTGVDRWHRIYRVADGWIAVSARTPSEGAAIDALLPAPDRTAADVLAALEGQGVACERVALDHRDAFFDAELAAGSGLVRRIEHTPYGWFENPGGFWTGPDGVLRADGPIGAVGEHTWEVLTELGFAPDHIDELIGAGVVAGPRPTED